MGIINHVRFAALLVPEFLPPQHEPLPVLSAEQRTDRRTLRRPSTRGGKVLGTVVDLWFIACWWHKFTRPSQFCDNLEPTRYYFRATNHLGSPREESQILQPLAQAETRETLEHSTDDDKGRLAASEPWRDQLRGQGKCPRKVSIR
jgi:hypothetical protein